MTERGENSSLFILLSAAEDYNILFPEGGEILENNLMGTPTFSLNFT